MVKWIGFATIGSINSTSLHFMPLAGENIAPVEVTCRIKLFGLETEPEEIECDGLRVAEPNGIQLNSLFPEVKPMHGEFCAFELSLKPERGDLDLSTSECIVEMQSSHGVLSYRPQKADVAMNKKQYSIPIFEAQLRNQSLSIIATNPLDQSALTNFEQSANENINKNSEIDKSLSTRLREVAPFGLEEIDICLNMINSESEEESSAGVLIASQKITNNEENVFSNSMLKVKHLEHSIPLYALYRDKDSGKASMVIDL